jgi:7,8-dihydro-6-hydroxymethylpterin-pyrophosphokinase
LPEKLPLALAKVEDVMKFNQAQHITDNKLTELRLSDVLQPKPLNFRDDKQFINSQVVENTSLFTQLKLQQLSFNKQQMQKNTEQLTGVKSTDSTLDCDNVYNQTLNTRQAVNVNAWLDVVQESIAKTSPVS